MTDAELENRYSYHAPFGDQAERYGRVRAKVLETARLICVLCPDSRERATALTHLDSVMFAANASIARNERPPRAPQEIPPPESIPSGACALCGGSGYEVHPENGWNKNAKRCRNGCTVSCSICRNPDCDNPCGQH